MTPPRRRARPEPHDVLRADQALKECALEDEPEGGVPQFFEQREEPLDVPLPRVRPLMNQLREIAFAHRPKLENPLAHEVEAFPRARDGGELRGALARQVTHRAVRRKARMHGLVPLPAVMIFTRSGYSQSVAGMPHAAAGIA